MSCRENVVAPPQYADRAVAAGARAPRGGASAAIARLRAVIMPCKMTASCHNAIPSILKRTCVDGEASRERVARLRQGFGARARDRAPARARRREPCRVLFAEHPSGLPAPRSWAGVADRP